MTHSQIEQRTLGVIGFDNQKRRHGTRGQRIEVVSDCVTLGGEHCRTVGVLRGSSIDSEHAKRNAVTRNQLDTPRHALGGERIDKRWIGSHRVRRFRVDAHRQQLRNALKNQVNRRGALAHGVRCLERHRHLNRAARGDRLPRHINRRTRATRLGQFDLDGHVEWIHQLDRRGDFRPRLHDPEVDSRRIGNDRTLRGWRGCPNRSCRGRRRNHRRRLSGHGRSRDLHRGFNVV